MDKNALTEQRRETVIGLLKGMDIKKSAEGGFDREDVYDCMQKLCDLYEKNIEELENNYEEELIILKDKYQKYDDNNDLYVSLIMEAKKSSNEIINQAKTEVETILNEGKAAVAQQEEELSMMKKNAEAEKVAIAEELNAAKQAVEAEKVAMKAELEAEKEKVFAMKNRYNQQLNSMEEEFMEIKTNILRTAGKIDSLKSKLPEHNEINWEVADEARSVEFPGPELQVEETIEPVFFAGEPAAVAEPVIAPGPIPVAEPVFEAESAPTAFAGVAEETLEAPPHEAFTLDDLTFGDITIDLPNLEEKPEAAAADAEAPGEISFDGLEELFKEDK
ncbi:MAG: hypothetical protein GX663_07135 [Clostridiales bacterium]|nr:hypothetical protein [Clostridiales bacterium]